MIFLFQSNFKSQVVVAISNKDHVSDGIGDPFFLNFILLVSLFFVVLSCLFVFLMVYSRIKRNKSKASDSILIEKYQNFLSSFLLLPNDDSFFGIQKNSPMDVRLSKQDITNKNCRTLLASEIYELKKMVRGQQASQLINYFFGLGLQEEVSALLKSRNWTHKVKGMQLVRSFNIIELVPLINQLINSTNRELSIHAIVARITIDKNLSVLDSLDYTLNLWELHKVHDAIKLTKINLNHVKSLCDKHVENEKHYVHTLFSVFEKQHTILELA